jgi:hypothetical protein
VQVENSSISVQATLTRSVKNGVLEVTTVFLTICLPQKSLVLFSVSFFKLYLFDIFNEVAATHKANAVE